MITDHDVVQYFRQPPRRIPIHVTDAKLSGNDRQIFRGIQWSLWKDVHSYGCSRHFEIFNKHKVIPKYCFDCYKVLIAPRNVLELFKLLMIFEKRVLPINNTRKCMVEERDFCSGAYKGYVYCRGIEEASEVLKIVRMAVTEDISPQVSVAIKHGCSEYEVAYPEFAQTEQSRAMQYNEDWQKYEEAVDNDIALNGMSNVDIPGVNATQLTYTPKEILAMQYWTRYAATIGDTSYIKIIGTTMQRIPNLNRPPFKNTVL
jgi:hypothetical protein